MSPIPSTFWNKSTLKNDVLTNLTEMSLSSEAAGCAAIQELPNILLNAEVHYHVHKSSPLVPNLSHMNPFHPISLQDPFHYYLPSAVFPSGLPTNIP
jgi:hypothetical protein